VEARVSVATLVFVYMETRRGALAVGSRGLGI
jgi:hypothetical protein